MKGMTLTRAVIFGSMSAGARGNVASEKFVETLNGGEPFSASP